MYLVRYAEEQQDLALLSISTFQRALKVNLTHFYSQHALRLSVEAVLLFRSVEFAILLPKVRVHACASRIQTS